MFSVDDDIDFSDEEINFSILNTPILKQASLKSNVDAGNENMEINKSNSNTKHQLNQVISSLGLTTKSQQIENQSNLLETPKIKRFKFFKSRTSETKTASRSSNPNTMPQSPSEIPLANEISETSKRFKFSSNYNAGKEADKKEAHTLQCNVSPKKNNCFDVPDNFFDDDDDDLLSQVNLHPNQTFTSSKMSEESSITTPKSKFKTKEPDPQQHHNTIKPTNSNIFRNSSAITSSSTESVREPGFQTLSSSNQQSKRKALSTPMTKNSQQHSVSASKTVRNLIQTPKNNSKTNNNRTTSRTPGETSLRKFPGPAGNLPKLENMNELDKLRSPEFNIKRKSITPNAPRTPLQMLQSTPEDNCHTESFSTMLEYATTHFPNETLLSINEVLYKSSQRKLDNCKVPLLCGIIKSFSIINNSARLILEDSTGEINGAVHNDILDEYQKGLGKGSGLILKDVSVFSPTIKRHYLNITPLNIAAFFERDPADDQLTQFTQVSNNSTIVLDSDS
ncbi:homologous recombination OB-fold protein-like [Clytia hemisphaerica]|uniref:Homologous recombination OB-fold protein OB-fold domain-containing protein n=1 Tax=Clytia hemisphaerica TaxID=252671 RepID=A0A7M5V5X6_9CNID|eukprot:TCONS_00032236-protein